MPGTGLYDHAPLAVDIMYWYLTFIGLLGSGKGEYWGLMPGAGLHDHAPLAVDIMYWYHTYIGLLGSGQGEYWGLMPGAGLHDHTPLAVDGQLRHAAALQTSLLHLLNQAHIITTTHFTSQCPYYSVK